MGLMKAAKLAPDALLLPADFDEYRRYSRMFKEAVRAIAPQVEDRGIDEIYIDLSELVMSDTAGKPLDPWVRARDVAAALLAGVLAMAIFSAAALGVTPCRPGGDEPHYLIITQSLLFDRDLKSRTTTRAATTDWHFQGDSRSRTTCVAAAMAPSIRFTRRAFRRWSRRHWRWPVIGA